MAMIEFLDQNQSQNPIAEKFQSLIVGVLGREALAWVSAMARRLTSRK